MHVSDSLGQCQPMLAQLHIQIRKEDPTFHCHLLLLLVYLQRMGWESGKSQISVEKHPMKNTPALLNAFDDVWTGEPRTRDLPYPDLPPLSDLSTQTWPRPLSPLLFPALGLCNLSHNL